MEFQNPILYVLIVVFISGLVRSALGFGDALLSMPLLAYALGIRTATPLVALIAATNAVVILFGNWQQVELKATRRLIISSVLGLPLGLFMLKNAPEKLVMDGLGILLVLFGLAYLALPSLPQLRGRLYPYLFGFLAGVLGVAYNTNGPPIVLYGSLQGWSPERFRATLQSYFFPFGLFILAGHALSGLWTSQVFIYYAWTLPIILLAILLGSRLNGRIPSRLFDRIIYATLIFLGVFLFVGS